MTLNNYANRERVASILCQAKNRRSRDYRRWVYPSRGRDKRYPQVLRPKREDIVHVQYHRGPKSGKTTTASKFPGAVIFAFEKGYSAIPGAMATPIFSWNDFKKLLKELESDEAKKLYQTVVIDTAKA